MALQLEIVTAERVVYSEEVDLLLAPGVEGELGILPSHAPLLTIMQPGEIRVDRGGEQSFIVVSGGFLEIIGNKATILADTAEHAEEIDESRAEEAMKKAQERVTSSGSDMDLERALASVRRSQARLKVARRRRSPRAEMPSG